MKLLLCGIGVWAVSFIVGIMTFSIQDSLPELFDSIMSITVCLAAVSFGVFYLRRVESEQKRASIVAGISWLAICIAIDLPIFILGFGMPFNEYIMGIGMTYLMVPIVLIGLGITEHPAGRWTPGSVQAPSENLQKTGRRASAENPGHRLRSRAPVPARKRPSGRS